MNEAYEKLAETDPAQRVLLISHCLRPSLTCPGRFNKQGLVCPEDCQEDCVVRRLAEAALSLGYGGVCTAAGGKMAIRFVAEHNPRGIVAVACSKELAEGVEAVQALAAKGEVESPIIVGVPLSKDGCVDTEVDERMAMEAIAFGCFSVPGGCARQGPDGHGTPLRSLAGGTHQPEKELR